MPPPKDEADDAPSLIPIGSGSGAKLDFPEDPTPLEAADIVANRLQQLENFARQHGLDVLALMLAMAQEQALEYQLTLINDP